MKNETISSIKAREIPDSRGNPTIEVSLETGAGIFRASVPSGASKGEYEAVELRDKDGRVRKAVENVNKIIAPVLKRENTLEQKRVDEILIQLDGTKRKSKLGANAILAVSMAVCRAAAEAKNSPLWQYINTLFQGKRKIPVPCFNIINGGKHAKGGLDIQEFMAVPQAGTFKENFQIGKKVFKTLKEGFGRSILKFGDEGGIALPLSKTSDAIELIFHAVKKAGYNGPYARYIEHPARYKQSVKIGLDCAASNFFKKGKYQLEKRFLSREELLNFYQKLIQKYPISFIEDPFAENDSPGFRKITQKLSQKVVIVGDDLIATNPARIKLAKKKKLCTGMILKPNQIGTITEALEAAKLAKSFGWKIIVSHRSGETMDNFIADLAVGIGAEFIKAGAPGPAERMAKYNRLLEIEKELK